MPVGAKWLLLQHCLRIENTYGRKLNLFRKTMKSFKNLHMHVDFPYVPLGQNAGSDCIGSNM